MNIIRQIHMICLHYIIAMILHDLSVKPIVEPLVVMDVSIYPSIRVFCDKFYKIYEEKYEKIDLFI